MVKSLHDGAAYYRVIDANLNRCREGLRVIEDTARFVLDLGAVYKKVRTLRHAVERLTRRMYPELLARRDAVADEGRTIPEGKREDLDAVLAANFRRAEESLRVLEEYSRLVQPELGCEFKSIRYAVYSLEKKLLAKQRPWPSGRVKTPGKRSRRRGKSEQS